MTHFADDQWSARTLCGLTYTAIIMNDRPATCPACRDAHAADGWTFPLPATVAIERAGS